LSGATECCLFRRREEAQIHDLLADHHLGYISALKGLRMPRM
jgi:hypothetical protein